MGLNETDQKGRFSPDHAGDNPGLTEGQMESKESRLALLQWYLKMILESEDEKTP